MSFTRRQWIKRFLTILAWEGTGLRSLLAQEESFFTVLNRLAYRHGRFHHPWEVPSRNFWDFLVWKLGLGEEESPPFSYPPSALSLPRVLSPDLEKIHHPNPQDLQITWIGHSTFLIQYRGINILTDPVFSTVVGPGNMIGSRRVSPPGVSPKEVHPLDLILISHNHYDHCDLFSLRQFLSATRVVVPLGIKELLQSLGFKEIEEWGWGKRERIGKYLILHCVPAQHFSGRGLCDHNATLWCGYVLEFPDALVYFAGDTGYGPFISEIARFYGEVTLALLPIGAYRPRWFMAAVHLDPYEAVQVHKQLRARLSVGMHWGTFELADEPLGEPPLYIKWACTREGVPEDQFLTLAIAETIVIPI